MGANKQMHIRQHCPLGSVQDIFLSVSRIKFTQEFGWDFWNIIRSNIWQFAQHFGGNSDDVGFIITLVRISM